MFPFMLFIFLCFGGMLAVLYFLYRHQERCCKSLRDEHAQTRVLLRILESRLDGLATGAAPPAQDPAADPLLSLSFGETANSGAAQRTVDPALDLHFTPETVPPPSADGR